jgi:hypothetical protein
MERRPGGPDGVEQATDATGSLSRRDFAARVGVGSAAAFGMAWAAPKISTVKFAMRAAAGSPPPSSTTSSTTTTTIGPGQQGEISLSEDVACIDDSITVVAEGFAPRTAVTIQINSSAYVIGVITANNDGEARTTFRLRDDVPLGIQKIRAVGIAPGGRSLVLEASLEVRGEDDCPPGPSGTTTPGSTSVSGSTVTTAPTVTTVPVTPTTRVRGSGTPSTPNQGSGLLAFTGTDALDLAVLGIAAAVGGRALYALARNGDDEDEDD